MGDLLDCVLREVRELGRVLLGGVGGEWPGEREMLEREEHVQLPLDDATDDELDSS